MVKNSNKLDIVTVNIDNIRPREINANKMEEGKFDFLVKYMDKVGYVQPIVVVKNEDDSYTIVDGEHRWRAAKENNIQDLDVVVVDLDLREQDIMSLNLNLIKGELQPDKFGELLRHIVDGDNTAELAAIIAMEQCEIDAYLKITEEVEASDFSRDDYAPPFVTYKFKVPTDDQNFFEECFTHMRNKFPIRDDADILYNLCSFYMRKEGVDYED